MTQREREKTPCPADRGTGGGVFSRTSAKHDSEWLSMIELLHYR